MADLWQPIETAPRDGTVVDLWSVRGFRYTNAAWDLVGGEETWGWTDSYNHAFIEDAGPFTHWQPLPAPPELKGK